jgi:S1-C subfamily serine protease
MMNISKLIILILLFLSFSSLQAEKIYKWKDKDGTMHYSKNPPPNQIENESLKVSQQRKGDPKCCSAVRKVINSMLSRSSVTQSKSYSLLINSQDFNATELNNFVASRVSSNYRNNAISQAGYDMCINAGFNFCRVPFENQGQLIKGKKQSYSGSGFYVSQQGYIVTNEHVVKNCEKIEIGPEKLIASLVKKDSLHDLALLKVYTSNINVAKFRSEPLILGEEIVTAGFPYKDILSSGIKITTGIVSSLAGIRNDTKVMQITAPIQPGNSGGPLIDIYGNIVGVIVSKLNSDFMIRIYKDIPQNVNFAIKGRYVKKFLDDNSIRYSQVSSNQKQDVTTISQSAQGYTVEVNCIN